MKWKSVFALALFFVSFTYTSAQDFSYTDSLRHYRERYIERHEVVQGSDKQHMDFFPISEEYRVIANFYPATSPQWIQFPTSANLIKTYIEYGSFHFTINDSLVTLRVYQPEALLQNESYKNYLFLPFTDKTTGEDCYEVGRYIDLSITDIIDGKCIIDFNKAYNPYCAYVSGKYNCPIPPKENNLSVAITAGEKKFHK